MHTLGIIGGMSPESTVSYYREINRLVNRARGGNTSAPLLLASVEFQQIAALQQQGRWDEAGILLARTAQTLEQAGAEALVLATNTMHKVAAPIAAAVGIPFLHVLDATAAAVRASGSRTVGLLGTRFTMQDAFYRDGLAERSLAALVPDDGAQAEIHRIIFEELCLGRFTPAAKTFYLDTIRALAARGAEGIILGCTEIGLLVQQQDTPVPLYDTAAIHARAAAGFVLNGHIQPSFR